MAKKPAKSPVKPSSNWEALRQTLPQSSSPKSATNPRKRKRKSAATGDEPIAGPSTSSGMISKMMKSLRGARHPSTSHPTPTTPTNEDPHLDLATKSNDVAHLRKMVLGKLRFTEAESKPGKYIALDCEMVQVARDTEPHSSLARVSVVNFYGVVLLDDFVKQEEFVTDYVTHISGVRPSDLKSDSARAFKAVQKDVGELLEGRVLIGHALANDLKVLHLTHPAPYTHDTQKSFPDAIHPKLKDLVKAKLGVSIQEGAHSSITDARAAMALFRLQKDKLPDELALSPPKPSKPGRIAKAKAREQAAVVVRKSGPAATALHKKRIADAAKEGSRTSKETDSTGPPRAGWWAQL